MHQILMLNKISPYGLERFDRSKYQLGDDCAAPEGILVRSASMHDLELPDSLRAIARAGAGVNNIPIEKCSEKGIVVFNTPGANANAVKEMVILGLLLSARKVYPGMLWTQSVKGQGAEVPKLVEKEKSRFVGPELQGKKLGVIGLGAIGILVANFARHLGMEVYGYDPYMSVDTAWKISHDIQRAEGLRDIYENCDFITLHLPCNSETRGMINSASIQMMKHGVRLLNFARGELVVDEDLLAGLDEKQIRCYVTDFPNDTLLGHPGVLAIPHLGASTPESEDNCAIMAVNQMVDYLENGNIQNSVNLPAVSLPRSAFMRVAVIHKNIPAMITKITNIISDSGVNIDNMINRSKGDYAYTLAEISDAMDNSQVDKLRELEGVVRVDTYR